MTTPNGRPESNPDESTANGGPGANTTGAGGPVRAATAWLTSPFTHHPPVGGNGATQVGVVERVDKPWGHEDIFAVLEGSYVGKVLHIDAGAALSLQRHLRKDETLSLRSGRITVDCGTDPSQLRTLTLQPGQQLRIRAGVVHRITAEVDSEVLEVSTAWPGWRTDIVRLADGYGRRGTSTP